MIFNAYFKLGLITLSEESKPYIVFRKGYKNEKHYQLVRNVVILLHIYQIIFAVDRKRSILFFTSFCG